MSSRRGFLIPLALLGLLAVTALALSSFVLARGMARDAVLERRYVQDWAAPQAVDTVQLATGWELIGMRGAGERRSYRVERVFDPPREALLWSSAVFAAALSRPAGSEVTHRPGAGPLLHHMDALAGLLSAERSGEPWNTDVTLPSGVHVAGPAILVVAGEDPESPVWILADGDVELGGAGTVRGIVLARGSVRVGAGVRWNGGVAASGWVEVDSGADIVLDPAAIESAVALLREPRGVSLTRGGPLGRF